MADEPATIAYAPHEPPLRAKLFRRRYVVPAMLLLVLASSYWWAPPIVRRVELEYWYYRCLSHEPLLGKVVTSMNRGGVDWPPPPQQPYVPQEWVKFYTLLSPPGLQSSGSAFLGKRQTQNGRTVLVAIDLVKTSPWASPVERESLRLHVRVFTAGGISRYPKQIVDAVATVPAHDLNRFDLLAGRINPSDPSRFEIPYDKHNGTKGAIDAWVRNDGTVDFERRRPPTQPLQASGD